MAENIVSTGAFPQQIGVAVATGNNSNFIDYFGSHKDFTVQTVFAGTISTASLQLQGTCGDPNKAGTQWFSMGSPSTATTSGSFQIINVPVRAVRVAVTITGGGTVDLYVAGY